MSKEVFSIKEMVQEVRDGQREHDDMLVRVLSSLERIDLHLETLNSKVAKNVLDIAGNTSEISSLKTFQTKTMVMWGVFLFIGAPATNTEQVIAGKDTAGASQRSYILNYNDSAGTKQLRMGVTASGGYGSNAVYSAISQTLTASTWYKLRAQFNSANANASKISYFVNGSNLGNGSMLVNTGTVTTIYNSTTNFRPAIYDSGTTPLPFIGRIDELRLKAGLVSNNWETTEYNNQSAESTFWGTWSDVGGGGANTTNFFIMA